MTLHRLAAAIALTLTGATPALAHSAERGFVLLLPTGFVMVGGALVVLMTFAVVSVLPEQLFHQVADTHQPIAPVPAWLAPAISLMSAGVLGLLIWVGLTGPRDPLANLLPLTIWSLWWVVIVLLHSVFGNLWAALNPFTGPYALFRRLSHRPRAPLLHFPDRLAYVPALLIFAAFAWFQLVFPGPEDPTKLAFVVATYAVLTLAAVCLFGPAAWLGKADPFAIFLAQLGAAAPLTASSRRGLALHLPGAGLLALPPLPLAGTLFVLLTLSCIAFDGFANTYLWLASAGVNPLEFPGRTAMMGVNSLGLAGAFVLLSLSYATTVSLGWLWAGRPSALSRLLGHFVYTLIPISIAFHFAHYLSGTLVNLQYLALALNDPFRGGANLLGLGDADVTTSFQNTAAGALALFTAQTSAIISGHVIAIAVAHAIALRLGLARTATLKLEAPFAAFMVLYTAFGLWLLAVPAIS